MGHEWKIKNVNFENMYNGLISLFILSTMEGWPQIYMDFSDGDDPWKGPTDMYWDGKNTKLSAIFFILIFIWIGSFALMNLFVGVLFNEYNACLKQETK